MTQSFEETEAIVQMAMQGREGAPAGADLLSFDDPTHSFAADLDGLMQESELLSSLVSDDYQVPQLGALLPASEDRDQEHTSADL